MKHLMVSKNVEVAVHSWTYILKRTRHFIFTQDAYDLTKLKTEENRDSFTYIFESSPVVNIYFGGRLLLVS